MIYAVCWVIFKTTNFLGILILSIFKFQAMTLEMKHILSSWVTLITRLSFEERVHILIFQTFLILYAIKLSCFICLKFSTAFVNIYMSKEDFPYFVLRFCFQGRKEEMFCFFSPSLPFFPLSLSSSCPSKIYLFLSEKEVDI